MGERVLRRFKTGKHLRYTIRPGSFHYRLKASIAAEAAMDGIYFVRTDLPATTLSGKDTVRTQRT